MSESPPSSLLLSDRPAHRDFLDFAPYTNSLADIIRDPDTPGPLVIGLFGSWGSGKTSLMQFVSQAVGKPPAGAGTAFKVAWFDAWKYGKEDALWRALLLRVIDSLRTWDGDNDATEEKLRKDIERLEQRLYRDIQWEEKGGLTIDWPTLGKSAAQGAVRLAFSFLPGLATLAKAVEAAQGKVGEGEVGAELFDAFRREVVAHHQAQLRSLEQFQEEFGRLVRQHIVDRGSRLVVFVDDLDRCLPEKAIEVLEAIKLFLDVEGCIFVLGLDDDVVTRGIEVKYRDFVVEEEDGAEVRRRLLVRGAAYLEKIIQLPFRLPPIEPAAVREFVKNLANFPDARCARVFGECLDTNPRRIKRAINIFLFLTNLAGHRRLPVQPVRLAKIVVIYHSHPELHQLLRQNPALLRDLEKHLHRQEPDKAPGSREEPMRKETPPTDPPPVPVRLLTTGLKTVLTLFRTEPDACFGELSYDDLSSYFTLTRGTVAETAGVPAQPQAGTKPAFPVPSLITIPAGSFEMGTSDDQIRHLLETTSWAKEWKDKNWFAAEQPPHRVTVAEFQIGRYPVTNAEYEAFVNDARAEPPSHWSGGGCPEGLAAHPVVQVNWQQAIDYCEWLTRRLREARAIDDRQQIRLPTEAEWERAARGDDGRIWSWGNEWDKSRCNSADGGPGTTTPVGQYSPAGDSPFGVADMAGNVWEWCQDWYDGYPKEPVTDPQGPESGSLRVLRGGGWNDPAGDCRSADRSRGDPSFRDNNLGFRVVLARSSVPEPVGRSGERERRAAKRRSA